MSTILSQCPSCGRHDIDLEKQCECGFNDKAIIEKLEKESKNTVRKTPIKTIAKPLKNKVNKQVLKEVDSWVFTFSQEENCINLSTPALNAFQLKITPQDLEDMLEYVYKYTNTQKTRRKLELSSEEISGLVTEVSRLIEEKRSKVSLTFDESELQDIEEFINQKLKE